MWAKVFCLSINKLGEDWVVKTPRGVIGIRFVPNNNEGILDHYVRITPASEVYVPMSVKAEKLGSRVALTLFQQQDMNSDDFERELKAVEQDLRTLKIVMEQMTGPRPKGTR